MPSADWPQWHNCFVASGLEGQLHIPLQSRSMKPEGAFFCCSWEEVICISEGLRRKGGLNSCQLLSLWNLLVRKSSSVSCSSRFWRQWSMNYLHFTLPHTMFSWIPWQHYRQNMIIFGVQTSFLSHAHICHQRKYRYIPFIYSFISVFIYYLSHPQMYFKAVYIDSRGTPTCSYPC